MAGSRPARRPSRGGRARRRAGDADPDAARPHRPTGQRAPAARLRPAAADRPARSREHDSSPDAFVAKLRFQQTKIEGAPNTIFVDGEIVAIIRAQQQWVRDHVRALRATRTRRHRATCSSPSPATATPPATPTPRPRFTRRLKQLGELADIRDSQGGRPPLPHVHRFRHTRATSLINAGVPVHVVQRYLGHLSAEMTMRYAHTLRETHEREFLRYKQDHRRRPASSSSTRATYSH